MPHLAHASNLGLAAVAEASPGSLLPFILAAIGVFILAILVIVAILFISGWKLFQKAGKPGWAMLVPFYNTVTMLRIARRPVWWIVLMFVPFVNIVVSLFVLRRLAGVFGKGRWFTVGLFFLPFIFFPILAFGSAAYAPEAYPEPAAMSDDVRWALVGLGAWALMEILVLTFAGSIARDGAQRTQLRLIGNEPGTSYATDGVDVYYQDVPVSGADARSFELIDAGSGYAADDYAVYYGGKRLSGADPDTFQTLDGGFSKDAQHVYQGSELISTADAATFRTFQGTGIAKAFVADATHVYTVTGTLIPDANPQTFTYLGNGYGKDAERVYYVYGENGEGGVVQGADPATFVLGTDRDTYDGKDKNYKYYQGVVLEE